MKIQLRPASRNLGYGTVLLLLVGVLAAACRRGDPVAAQGERARGLFFERNAAGMASMADEHELKLTGTDKERFQRLLENEIFAEWQSDGPGEVVQDYRKQGLVVVRMPMTNEKGQEFVFSMTVSATDDGVQWVNPTTGFFMILANADAASKGISPTGLNKIEAWRNFAVSDGPRWEREYGLKGVVFGHEGSLTTWEQVAQKYDEVLAENQR